MKEEVCQDLQMPYFWSGLQRLMGSRRRYERDDRHTNKTNRLSDTSRLGNRQQRHNHGQRTSIRGRRRIWSCNKRIQYRS